MKRWLKYLWLLLAPKEFLLLFCYRHDDSVEDFRGKGFSNDDLKARGSDREEMGVSSVVGASEHWK